MSGIAGGTNGRNQFDLFKFAGNRQNRGTSKAVSDQQVNGQAMLFQCNYRRSKIFQVSREIRVGEITFALPKTCKVKTQHCEALVSQSFRNTTSCMDVLVAGKTMSEHGYTATRSTGLFKRTGQRIAITVLKLKLCRHYVVPIQSSSILSRI